LIGWRSFLLSGSMTIVFTVPIAIALVTRPFSVGSVVALWFAVIAPCALWRAWVGRRRWCADLETGVCHLPANALSVKERVVEIGDEEWLVTGNMTLGWRWSVPGQPIVYAGLFVPKGECLRFVRAVNGLIAARQRADPPGPSSPLGGVD
jgi:hypothetical protein